jgi:hypothetical protein
MTKKIQTNQINQNKKAVYFIATKYKAKKAQVSFYTKEWKSVPKGSNCFNSSYSLE